MRRIAIMRIQIVVKLRAALCRISLLMQSAHRCRMTVLARTADCPVDRPTSPRDLDIGVLGLDLLAEEARRLAGDVGDQRLGLRQLQLQFLRRNAAIFDLMSLAPCF